MGTIKQIIKAVWNYFKNRKKSWKFARGCLILAGGLLTGPLWLPFLTAVIESNTGTDIDEPSPLLALPVLAIGGLVAVIPELIELKVKSQNSTERTAQQKVQDEEYAKKIRDLLTETRFDDFQRMFGDSHIMKEEHRGMLNDLRHELESDETGFIDASMESYAGNYLSAINQTLAFSARYFFTPNNPLIRDEFWLFPEGNWDRGAPTPEQERRYVQLTKKLNEVLDNLIAHRSEFLRHARNSLLFSN